MACIFGFEDWGFEFLFTFTTEACGRQMRRSFHFKTFDPRSLTLSGSPPSADGVVLDALASR